MVKWDKDIVYKGLVDELTILAFFFVPFLNFSPVASGVILLSSLITIITNLKNNKGMGKMHLNLISVLVLVFMLYTIVSSIFVVQEMRPFTRLVFEIRLPMLLLSLALIFLDSGSFHPQRALGAFALGALASALIASIVFIFSLFTAFDNIPHSFLNVQLCFQCVIGLISHRTYLCFNLITSLIICYYLYSKGWTKKRIVIFLLFTLFVAFAVFFSDARISMITFLWVILFIVSREIKHYWGGKKYIVFISIVLVAFLFILFQNNRINNILLSISFDSVSFKDLDPRFYIWNCGLNCYCSSPHPWIGTGAGSAADLLMSEYHRIGFNQAIESHWEMHNQFLEVLLENGVIGLLLFLSALLSPIFLKNRLRLFFLIWIPALCLNLFFESMLSRSIGTYPIITILILSGITDEKELDYTSPLFSKTFFVLTVIAILATSIKYISIDKKETFSEFQRGFERVDKLPGDVPEELIGCYGLKIDSTTSCQSWQDRAIMYHRLDQRQMGKNDSLYYSLYIYASDDFNADELYIRTEERKQKALVADYDLSKKGSWQKLEISGKGLYGNTLFLIYCQKKHSKDFDKLKGFAIFANPIIIIDR